MKRKIKWIFFLIFFLSIAFSYAETETAKVIYIRGHLYIKDGEKWENLSVGDQLFKGDIIKTARRSYAELKYGDKVIVKIASNTKLKVQEFKPEKKTIKSFFGKIWMKVKHLVAEKFEVTTRFGTAGVRGTSFGISADPNKGMTVDCEEGRVYVRDPKGMEKDVPAGFICKIDKKGKIAPLQKRKEGVGFSTFGNDEKESIEKELDEIMENMGKLLKELKENRDKKLYDELLKLMQKAEKLIKETGVKNEKWPEIKKEMKNLEAVFSLNLDEKIKELKQMLDKVMKNGDMTLYGKMMVIVKEIRKKIKENGISLSMWDEFEKELKKLEEKMNNTELLKKRYSNLYKTLVTTLDKWNGKFSLQGNNVDFSLLNKNADDFLGLVNDYQKQIDEMSRFYEQIGDKKQAMILTTLNNRLKKLKNLAYRMKEIVKFEENLYVRMQSTKQKIRAFKHELETFLTHTDSASLWIEKATFAIRAGKNLSRYQSDAANWKYFYNRYNALNSEFSDYKNLVGEAKRKGVFYVSKRVSDEYSEMMAIVTNFKVKKGCCMVTMNFGQLRRTFLIIGNFLNTAIGKELLK